MIKIVMAAFLAASLAACAANETAPVSAFDKAHMRPEAMAKRMLGQFYAKADLRKGYVPDKPLTYEWMGMLPAASHIPELCQRDGLGFELVPDKPVAEPDSKTPMRVAAVTASRYFHFLKAPAPDLDHKLTYPERAELDARCAALNEDTPYFGAVDENNALEGMQVLLALREQAASFTDEKRFDCAHVQGGCKELFAVNLDDGGVGFGNHCEAGPYEGCVTMGWPGAFVTARYTHYRDNFTFLSIRHQQWLEEIPPIYTASPPDGALHA